MNHLPQLSTHTCCQTSSTTDPSQPCTTPFLNNPPIHFVSSLALSTLGINIDKTDPKFPSPHEPQEDDIHNFHHRQMLSSVIASPLAEKLTVYTYAPWCGYRSYGVRRFHTNPGRVSGAPGHTRSGPGQRQDVVRIQRLGSGECTSSFLTYRVTRFVPCLLDNLI